MEIEDNKQAQFDEIRPYEPEEMQEAFNGLLNDRHFNAVMKGFAPWLPKGVRNVLLRLAFTGVKTPLDFQKRFMKPVVKYIIRKHTDGCTFDDTAVSHRAARSDKRFTFVIGDNLLIYPWIKRLVRMNKAFTVRRGLTPKEMLRSSQLMSSYIHYAVNTKKENIWIAQREGRAKDSDDRTQDAVLKMLAMGGDLSELNIVPLTISYEYDPCDYLKAQEFQQKRDNPSFKKSRQDDLDNMKTGIFGYKGRVHYHCAAPINTWIGELKDLPKKEFFAAVAERMDQEIHRHYRLYPCNYIALDILEGQSSNNSHYTEADRQRFEQYLSGQLAKISIPNKDDAFLRQCMLRMYANPLRNYLREKGRVDGG